MNVSQIISKASAYPDIVDGIGEISMIRQHGLETIESAYKEILDTQMKMLENVEQKEMIEAAVKESQNEDMHLASEGLSRVKSCESYCSVDREHRLGNDIDRSSRKINK